MADPDKTLGQKILGFFVKDEPPAAVTGPPSPVPRPAAPATGSPPSAGTVDPRFADHFTEVLNKANVQGPDYFEFRETLRSLADLGLPEEKQYQAAWASFRTMAGGSSVALLLSTANQYLTALSTDRDLFLKSVESTLNERVGSLRNEQKQLLAENETLAKQITELQGRINANNERLARLGGELTEQGARLSQNRDNFEATYASFTGQIKQDIAHIQAYLGNGASGR